MLAGIEFPYTFVSTYESSYKFSQEGYREYEFSCGKERNLNTQNEGSITKQGRGM